MDTVEKIIFALTYLKKILAIYGLLFSVCVALGVLLGFVGYFGKQPVSTLSKKSDTYFLIGGLTYGLLKVVQIYEINWLWLSILPLLTYLGYFITRPLKYDDRGVGSSIKYFYKFSPLIFVILSGLVSKITIYLIPVFCLFFGICTALAGVFHESTIITITQLAHNLLWWAFVLLLVSPFVVGFIIFFIYLFA